jgi:hypothetical protein
VAYTTSPELWFRASKGSGLAVWLVEDAREPRASNRVDTKAISTLDRSEYNRGWRRPYRPYAAFLVAFWRLWGRAGRGRYLGRGWRVREQGG